MKDLKTIFITGANTGIGFETAKQLARLGHTVFIGSRDIDKGQAAVKDLTFSGLKNIISVEIDLTNSSSIEKALVAVLQTTDFIDVLINNAGISGEQPQTFSGGSTENLRHIFETNFFGTVMVTQHFLPLLKKSSSAWVINVSSEVGSLELHSKEKNTNRSNFHMYGASKAALNAFTIMLANELHAENIVVHSVTPGYTATKLNHFQGAKTVEQGANAIVKIISDAETDDTGKFYKDDGIVPW